MVLEDSDVEMMVDEIEVSVSRFSLLVMWFSVDLLDYAARLIFLFCGLL